MITPLPGATATKPGSATLPFFGVVPVVLDGAALYTDYKPYYNNCKAPPGARGARRCGYCAVIRCALIIYFL
jgi:hypothetical protein